MSIGADTKSHIVINDTGVDAQHAEITKKDEALYLSDCGSKAGTIVNGARIKQHFQLRAGDVINIAGVELEILEPKSASGSGSRGSNARTDWSIMALSGELKGKKIPLKEGSWIFGRSNTCDVVVNDSHMSRRHAEVSLKSDQLRIVDLQSSNGTCVNGEKVGERLLKTGDKISFDHTIFLVAGPLDAVTTLVDDEDDVEMTVFRTAPIPRPEKPKPPASEIVRPAESMDRVEQVSVNAPVWPWIMVVCLVVLLTGLGLGFMMGHIKLQ